MSFLKNFRISALFPKGGGGNEETDGFDPDMRVLFRKGKITLKPRVR